MGHLAHIYGSVTCRSHRTIKPYRQSWLVARYVPTLLGHNGRMDKACRDERSLHLLVMSRLLRRLARNEALQTVSPELCKNSF